VSAQPYPNGIDCVWLASDRDGHFGAFMTAGVGPIPLATLDYTNIPVEDIEGRLCELPLVSQAELLVSVKRPDDFIDLAERGVFVYDWADINRTARAARRVYEPVAGPTRPITASLLPSDLAALVEIVRLADVAFAAMEAVDVRSLLSCAEARAD